MSSALQNSSLLTYNKAMTSYLRSMISSLYEAVSAPVAATRDALTERLKSVRETASLLYRKTKERLGYGEALKATVEDAAVEEQVDHSAVETEGGFDGNYRHFQSEGTPEGQVVSIEQYLDQLKEHVEKV